MQMLKINSKVKPDTLASLKQECEKQGRTESGMIRKILEDYFKDGEMVITCTSIKAEDLLTSYTRRL